MENIMHRTMVRPFWIRWVVRMAIPVAAALSKFLNAHAKEDWEKAVFPVGKMRGQGAGASLTTSPEAFKRKSLESLAQSGSPSDTLRHRSSLVRLPDWTKEIQPFLLNQLSEHTRRAYETDLKQFFRFLEGRIEPAQLTSLSPEHIILYRKSLEEGRLTGRPMEKSTINRKLAVIKSFMNWLKVNRIISDNPASLVKGYPQNQESSLKGLSDEEVRKILDKPNQNSRSGTLHAAVLTCLLYLGLRKGELLALKVGDLDEERGVPVIKVRGKGHRIRILPITEAVSYAIKHYFFVNQRDFQDKEAPLFVPTKNPRTKNLYKSLNPNAITYIVIRYAKKSGILKQISPHSCRATCISNALDKKATHRAVQALAGWSTPLMIQRYDKRREDLKNSAAFLVDYSDEEQPASA
jgi:integrase